MTLKKILILQSNEQSIIAVTLKKILILIAGRGERRGNQCVHAGRSSEVLVLVTVAPNR